MEPQVTDYVLLKYEIFCLILFSVFHISNVLYIYIYSFLDIVKITNNCNRENILIFKSKLCFRGTGSSDDHILSGCILNRLWEREKFGRRWDFYLNGA